MFARYAISTGNAQVAAEAVRISWADAETHFNRASLLRADGLSAQALAEFERAVSLRPRDYYLWMELALAREEMNDSQGALAAINEAVRLAPYYARPRWLRGNMRLRERQYDDAFADLRQAAASDPDLVPGLIDLAWGFSQSNVNVAEQLAQIQTPELRLAFARHLARQGHASEALAQFKAAGEISDQDRKELVARLIARNAYLEAAQVWRGTVGEATIYDGGFESPLSLDEDGFGWRVSRYQKGAVLTQDAGAAHTGSRSLQIEFNGESPAETPLVSQLVVVKPSQTYELSFAYRSKEIVAGGLPFVTVNDTQDRQQLLGESPQVPAGSGDWGIMTFSFKTGPSTNAVLVSLRRHSCSTAPCPAFGTLWLDSLGLSER